MRSAPGASQRLGDPKPVELGFVRVQRVVVPDPERMSPSAPAGTSSKTSPTRSSGSREAEAREVPLDLLERRVAELEAVDADEPLVLVAQHRRDRGWRRGRRRSRRMPLPRSRHDAARLSSARLFSRARFSTSSTIGANRRSRGCSERGKSSKRRGSSARKRSESTRYRWLVTPARLGSSDGGSYHE